VNSRSRPSIHAIVPLLFLMALAICLNGCGLRGTSKSETPRLKIYIGVDTASAQYAVARNTLTSRTVYTSADPLLTEDEIADLQLGAFADGFPVLTLDLTSTGIRKLADRAGDYMNNHLVIVWDDQLISSPRIVNQLSGQIAIVASSSISSEKLQAIYEYLTQYAESTTKQS